MTRPEAALLVRERWERLGLDPEAAPIMFGCDVDNMLEDLSPENILDVAPQGVAGVSGSTDGRADEGQARFAKSVSGGSTTPEMAGSRSVTLGRSVLRDAVVTCHRGQCSPNRASENQASPADSQYQGLTIEWLTGAVISAEEHAEQLRLEEEAAAEEGAAIEASNLPYPEYERNGR